MFQFEDESRLLHAQIDELQRELAAAKKDENSMIACEFPKVNDDGDCASHKKVRNTKSKISAGEGVGTKFSARLKAKNQKS